MSEKCGCSINYTDGAHVIFCHLHAHAGEMQKALIRIADRDHIDGGCTCDFGDNGYTCGFPIAEEALVKTHGWKP